MRKREKHVRERKRGNGKEREALGGRKGRPREADRVERAP